VILLSLFPACAITLFVCLAVASKKTQMVQGSEFTVNGCFTPLVKSLAEYSKILMACCSNLMLIC
jgi:hypothetical protein